MTLALTLLALIIGPPDHGGPAATVPPPRGGHAEATPEPVRNLARFRAWVCIHEHEGAWNANTGNGYHGGLQMDWSFMRSYGRSMLQKYGGRGAEVWTPAEQIRVAERAYVSGRGFYPWPNTARACGLI